MRKRFGVLGGFLMLVGIVLMAAGAVAYTKVQDGYDSLQAFSAAQNVQLSYDDDGNLIDRGSTEGAEAIMSLLVDDWKYPVVDGDFDTDDPLVNTGSEYMFQMATVAYHVMDGTQTVVLDEAVEYEGTVYEAGTYEVAVDGRYWTGFDRQHPLEGPAREQAWSGTVHGLVGELGVGTVTHSTLQMGLAIAGLFAGLGVVFLASGAGVIWVGRGRRPIPDTTPVSFVTEPIASQPAPRPGDVKADVKESVSV
jgi:hypothetical protein